MAGDLLGMIGGAESGAAASGLGGAITGAVGATPFGKALGGVLGATGAGNPFATAAAGAGGAIPTVANLISGSANPSGAPVTTVPTVSATPTIATQGSVAPAKVYAALQSQGFSPVQSVALLGNMKQESQFNPGAVNPGEGAQGLIQWRGSRLANLQKFAQANGLDPSSYTTQAAFLKHEMTTTESAAGQKFLAATNVQDANAALKSYIRYGSPPDKGGINTRLANSMDFAKQFGVNAAPTTAGGTGVTTTLPQAGPTITSAPNPMMSPQATPGAQPMTPVPQTPTPMAANAQKLATLLKQAHTSTAPAPQVGAATPVPQTGITQADTSRKQALLAPAQQILAELKQGTLPSPNLPSLTNTKSPVTI